MESLELKKLLSEIGYTVHSMNTIAVALELLTNENAIVPNGLDVSWKPSDIIISKKRSRTYACKSAYVYVAESLYEYLDSISKNPLWLYKDINFSGSDKKADKVYSFLVSIPNINEEMVILSELICHWRNRIIHKSSTASLTKQKISALQNQKDFIYESYHHFDVSVAVENFKNGKITLKDVSTMATIAIKCCRIVDDYYFQGIANLPVASLGDLIKENIVFSKFINQPVSEKTKRQLKRLIDLQYPYLEKNKRNEIFERLSHE